MKPVKKIVNDTFDEITPNSFNKVISKINNKKGVILKMKEEKKKKKFLLPSLVAVTVILGFFGILYYNNVRVFAKIGLDVNPSVEIKINKNNKVIETIALNEDGKTILGSMDFKGSSLDVTTNALIGSMLKHGYIDELKNSILLSVESNNKEEAERIKASLALEIDELLKGNAINASVMSQVVSDNSLHTLANEHKTSVGKIQLIKQIMSNNELYKIEDLVNLSINELNLLTTSKKNNVSGVDVQGAASDKTYIGKSKVKEIAFKNAGVSEANVKGLEVEFDLERGIMVYEVEFSYNNIEYDYEINATTGSIIKGGKEVDDDKIEEVINKSNDNDTTSSYISKSKAKEIALKHAGVSNIKDYSIEFEYKAGKGVYEIEFESDNKEYDYEINATTGAIVKYNSKVDIDANIDDDKDDDTDEDDD